MARLLARLALAILFVCAGVTPAFAQSAPPAGDVVSIGNLTYLNAVQQVAVNGESTCTVSIAGTFSATVTFEGTSDGVNWYAIPMTPYAGGSSSSTATAAGLWFSPCAGLQAYRARVSAFTSGAVQTVLRSSMGVAAAGANGGTISGQTSFTNVPSGGCTTGAPTAAVCVGSPTSTVALAVGKVSGAWGGTTASASGQIAVCANTGSADRCGNINETSGGIFQISSAGAGNVQLVSSGNLDISSAGLLRAAYITQGAANNWAGTCAMSAGTSCTFTIGHTFTTPICNATVQSTTVIAGGCTVSGTTVTVTAASSNSSTWAAFVTGNPS